MCEISIACKVMIIEIKSHSLQICCNLYDKKRVEKKNGFQSQNL